MSKKILVMVDVQNDFLQGGALPYGFPPYDVVPDIVEFLKRCDPNQYKGVILTQDTHQPTKYIKNAEGEYSACEGYFATLEGKMLPVEHCIQGSKGWELDRRLEEQILISRLSVDRMNKPTFGCSELPAQIREIAKKNGGDVEDYEIEICGFDTSICVAANAIILRAAFPDNKITLLSKYCGDVNEKSQAAACAVLRNQQIEIA